MSELEKFRQFLIGLLTEARELDKRAKGIAHTAIEANIRLLEREIVFISNSIKQGELDMDKARSEIKVLDEGIVEELGRSRRESPVTSKIIELAGELKPKGYKRLDPKGIEWTHFSTRVYNLRQQGAIPQDVKPKNFVNGEKGLFLVRLTKEQMSAEPKRGRKVSAN